MLVQFHPVVKGGYNPHNERAIYYICMQVSSILVAGVREQLLFRCTAIHHMYIFLHEYYNYKLIYRVKVQYTTRGQCLSNASLQATIEEGQIYEQTLIEQIRYVISSDINLITNPLQFWNALSY